MMIWVGWNKHPFYNINLIFVASGCYVSVYSVHPYMTVSYG